MEQMRCLIVERRETFQQRLIIADKISFTKIEFLMRCFFPNFYEKRKNRFLFKYTKYFITNCNVFGAIIRQNIRNAMR